MAEHKKSNKGLVCVLILVSILLVVVPFLALRGAEFGGSDDAGSQMVNEVTGTEYERKDHKRNCRILLRT